MGMTNDAIGGNLASLILISIGAEPILRKQYLRSSWQELPE